MLSTLVNTIFVVALATRHVAAQLEILTPTLIQCQVAAVSWSGGIGDYSLYVVPSGNPCADSVVTIPEQKGTVFNWTVSLPAGSTVEFMVEDATLAEAWSGIMTVQNSSDASCVDPKATQALLASNSLPQSPSNSTNASSITPSSASLATPSTPAKIPSASSFSYASGAAKTVVPAANPSGLANAAGSGTSSQSNSGPSRAALPTCSLLGVAAFLFTMVHLP